VRALCEGCQEWKEEAMQLWKSGWAGIYPPSSSSRKVIDTIASTYWHVYMVDNNFMDGDIFRVFSQLLNLDPNAGSPIIRPQKARAEQEGIRLTL
jgi:hypothetical protein